VIKKNTFANNEEKELDRSQPSCLPVEEPNSYGSLFLQRLKTKYKKQRKRKHIIIIDKKGLQGNLSHF